MKIINRTKIINYIDSSSHNIRVMFRALLALLTPMRSINEKILYSKCKRKLTIPLFTINPDIGYIKIENPIPNLNAIIQESLDIYKNYSNLSAKNNKSYLKEISSLRDFSHDSATLEFATSPEVIKSVCSYLRCMPVLSNITTMISEAQPHFNQDKFEGSQLWHLDGEDIRNVKLWILCSPIEIENGPTTLLDAKSSNLLMRSLSYKQGFKITDTIVNPFIKSTPFSMIGKIGSAFATDTDRCFHYGSRVSNNQGPRIVLMIHYVSSLSGYYRPFLNNYPVNNNYRKMEHQKLNADQRLVMRFSKLV
jgi:hypothetical protein